MSCDVYKSREWLEQKYLIEMLDANAIGRLVGRDGKTIWSWLRKLGIKTRPRGGNTATQFKPGQTSAFKGRRHTPELRARLSAIAKAQGRVPYDPAIGSYMKGKRGSQVPNWKGGITPERQAFYSTAEWKEAVCKVWKRDNATCQRCGVRNEGKRRYAFDVHHIVSFAFRPLRSEETNLVLLCERCHYWVHSPANVGRLFIKEVSCS